MRNAPTNRDDIIYSRDVIARIEELTDERDALQEAIDEAQTALKRLKRSPNTTTTTTTTKRKQPSTKRKQPSTTRKQPSMLRKKP